MATLSEVKDWYFCNIHGADEQGFKKLCGTFKYAKRKKQRTRTLCMPIEVRGRVTDCAVRFSFNTQTDRHGNRKPYTYEVVGPAINSY